MDFGTVFMILFGLGFMIVAVYVPAKLVIGALRAVDERAREKNERRLVEETTRTRPRWERSLLKPCTHCQVFCLTLPHRDDLGRTYCSEACARWLGEGPRSFCRRCLYETTPEPSGDLHNINGIGLGFGRSSDPCAECGSVVRRVFFTLLYVPIVPLKRYRVLHASPQEFLSRLLRRPANG